MYLVRGEVFFQHDGKYYVTGSSSNLFFKMLVRAIGPFTMMIWVDHRTDKFNPSNMEEFDNSLGIRIIPIDKPSGYLKKNYYIKNIVKKADCLSFKLPLPESIIGCFWALLYRKPFVIESGGDSKASLWYHGSLAYKLAAWPTDMIVKIQHKLAKHIIYVSKSLLQRCYPSKARQIGCSDAIIGLPEEGILQKRIEHIKSKKGAYVLGLIGATHAEYRGHDTLIEAASVLVSKGYDVRVSFLGGGNADEKRRTTARRCKVEDRVEFYGRVPHDQVLNWIDGIDILVMPTLVESLGRAVIEAMSRGCPVIGTYETALGEQIGSDCLVHARNVNEIVTIIERIINHKDYATYCAYENFYRSMKYNCDYTYRLRKEFYDEFYKIEGLA